MTPSSGPGRRRRRPLWHRPVGWALAALAVTLIVLNDLVLLGGTTPLPGGHNELYFIAGLAVVGAGLWLTGVMDARGG